MQKPDDHSRWHTQGAPTKIQVRVIARDGKFLGDDVGGASIAIRDADTSELLARGTTSGASGNLSLHGPGLPLRTRAYQKATGNTGADTATIIIAT